MVMQAISCSGIENIVNHKEGDDIFDENFMKQLDELQMHVCEGYMPKVCTLRQIPCQNSIIK